jgi:hypothetical protein
VDALLSPYGFAHDKGNGLGLCLPHNFRRGGALFGLVQHNHANSAQESQDVTHRFCQSRFFLHMFGGRTRILREATLASPVVDSDGGPVYRILILEDRQCGSPTLSP